MQEVVVVRQPPTGVAYSPAVRRARETADREGYAAIQQGFQAGLNGTTIVGGAIVGLLLSRL